jgi:hypothetical protein
MKSGHSVGNNKRKAGRTKFNASHHQQQKQSDEGAALFAVRVHAIVMLAIP